MGLLCEPMPAVRKQNVLRFLSSASSSNQYSHHGLRSAHGAGGRRRRSPITHGSALVAFERSRLALAPLISSRRKYWLPRLDMPPNRFLPPVEFWRGTRPSHAANSRPLRIFHISVLNCCKSSAHRAAEALLSLISRPPPRLRMA